jgi:hypothetical protein
MGGPYNPAHGQYEWDTPNPWVIQQGLDVSGQGPTVEGSLIGGVPPRAMAGADPDSYADPTATLSHGGPWPHRHIANSGAVNDPVAAAQQSIANMELHAIDSGVVASFTQWPGITTKMPWEISPEYETSGTPDGADVGILAGNNMTGRDRFVGDLAGGDNLNQYGMDGAHVARQTPSLAAYVPVPLDTTQGAQRPMVMNVPGRYDYATGPGSPFAGQIPGAGNDVGAAEIGVASDYVPPPDPPTNPALGAPAGSPVWGWTGLGY